MNPEKITEIARKLRGVGTYLYPPFLAWALGPLAHQSYEQAALVFQIFSFLMLISFFAFVYIIKTLSVSVNPAVFLYAFAFSLFVLYRYILENYTNGNIGFILIFLTGAGLILSWKKEVIWQIAGGLFIGIAAVLKVTPVYMGLVLLAGRRWNAILGAVLGGLIGLALPSVSTGLSGNLDMLMNWKTLILEQYSKTVIVRPWANNQTVSAAAGKYLIPLSDNRQGEYGLPLINKNPVKGEDFSEIKTAVKSVNYLFTFILFAASLYLAFKRKLPGSSEDVTEDRRFSHFLISALLISLLVSGVSWYHAYSLLILPVFFLSLLYFRKKEYESSVPEASGGPHLPVYEKYALYTVAFFGVLDPLLPEPVRTGIALYSFFTFAAAVFALIFLYLSLMGSCASEKSDGI